jgi:hypothetical protein
MIEVTAMAMFEGFCEGLSLVFLILLFVIAWRALPTLPARIPIQFGFDGRPDNWGPRGSIWLMPACGLFVYLLVSFAGGAVWQEAGAEIGAAMALLKAETLAMFAFIEREMVRVALGRADRLSGQIWLYLVIVVATSLLLIPVSERSAPSRDMAGTPATQRAPLLHEAVSAHAPSTERVEQLPK